VLTVTTGPNRSYYFDFNRCRDSAGMLDQIFQIYTLGWLKDRDIRDLLKAIGAVLRPQANYLQFWKKQEY
jgi:hypothetical protein